MRLFGLVLASIIMFSVIGINEAFALNCMADDSCSVDQIANVFDIIFLGNVISTEQNKVSFNVEKTWIGNITENKDMTMICQNLNCELSFVVDEDYLVIGFYRDTVPTVSGKLSKLASDAKEDLKILNDPDFQTNHINNLELLKKLKETQDNGIINLIEGFTPSLIFVDTFNLELVIGLAGNLTQEDAEYYEIQLKEIVGDIPMNVGFSPGGIREDVLILERISAPLKQIKDGIPLDDVKCKHKLQLIFKSSDNSPACVKPETAEKLMERGWASPIIENSNKAHLDIELDPILYSGGPVSSKMIEIPRVTDSSIAMEPTIFPSDKEIIISNLPRVDDIIDITFIATYHPTQPHTFENAIVAFHITDTLEFLTVPEGYELEYTEPQSPWGKQYPGIYSLKVIEPIIFDSDVLQEFTVQAKAVSEGITTISAGVFDEQVKLDIVIGSTETLLRNDYYVKYPQEIPESIQLPTSPEEQAAFEKKYGVSFGTTTIKTNITEEEHRIWLENYGMPEDEIKEALERIFG